MRADRRGRVPRRVDADAAHRDRADRRVYAREPRPAVPAAARRGRFGADLPHAARPAREDVRANARAQGGSARHAAVGAHGRLSDTAGRATVRTRSASRNDRASPVRIAASAHVIAAHRIAPRATILLGSARMLRGQCESHAKAAGPLRASVRAEATRP
ncbi:hypothetical protein PT2222_220030 [Paraburkholderia tropica]